MIEEERRVIAGCLASLLGAIAIGISVLGAWEIIHPGWLILLLPIFLLILAVSS
jgi:hypothetical protein